MNNFSNNLSETLEPIAEVFRSFHTPEPIVHWGHPLMMGIVVFVMGSFVASAGWRARLGQGEEADKQRADHRQLAPLLFFFIAAGYTGGVLSLVMQNQPILESPHFWTGSTVILLLALNGLLAIGFSSNKAILRNLHAYLGSAAVALLVIHAILGLKLGLSI